MHFIKKNGDGIVETIYLGIIFLISQLPVRDYDIWFHIKSGELFVKQGHLQFTEVFSHAAYGRQWIPYEWLFQVIVYLLNVQFGFWVLTLFITFFVVSTQFLLLRILKYIFSVGIFARILITFGFFTSIYEFNTIRPHIIAYCFLTLTILLCLARMKKGKKWIYLSPLYIIIWTNLHTSIFIAWGMELIFCLINLISWLTHRKKEHFLQFCDFGVVAIVTFLLTITPPLNTLGYKLLWDFFSDRKFLAAFIAEWSPVRLSDNPLGVLSYTFFSILSLISVLYVYYKERGIIKYLWTIPFFMLILSGYTATRNVFLGDLASVILIGFGVAEFFKREGKFAKRWIFLLGVCTLVFFIFMLNGKSRQYATQRLYFPVGATDFIVTNLKGNMFNDYDYGGYIVYHVYPKLKIFLDGRSDVFRCCEMRDFMDLSLNKYEPDEQYRTFLNTLFTKYDISFVVLGTTKHNVLRRIQSLLSTDPSWSLVYWDDDAQVFVKRDGKNDNIIQKFGTFAATPYLRDPYIKGKAEQALFEYQKMDTIKKSAHTSNVLGYFLLQSGQFDAAKERFTQALLLDPTFESPYMNLGELMAKDGDIAKAIDYYSKARSLAPDRGLIYIRLGQLTAQRGDTTKARQIWQDGVKNTVDEDAKEQLKNLLSS